LRREFIDGKGSPFILPSDLSFAYFSDILQASLIITVASMVISGILTQSGGPTGIYEINISSRRADSTNLRIRYTDPKGKSAADLKITKVRLYPDVPLSDKANRSFIRGTKASMAISFERPKKTLWLGFSDPDEFSRIRDALGK
jgi:hypothetical protein